MYTQTNWTEIKSNLNNPEELKKKKGFKIFHQIKVGDKTVDVMEEVIKTNPALLKDKAFSFYNSAVLKKKYTINNVEMELYKHILASEDYLNPIVHAYGEQYMLNLSNVSNFLIFRNLKL